MSLQSGVICSWWENEEQPGKAMFVKLEKCIKLLLVPVKTEPSADSGAIVPSSASSVGDGSKLSPVYSMDVQSEALWGLTGMESGNINLVTIRHEEGKCHHVLRNHTAPVSVLQITPQETGVISGSWDKSVLVSESCLFHVNQQG